MLLCALVTWRGSVWAVLMLAMSVPLLSDSKKRRLLRVGNVPLSELVECDVSY